MAVPEGGLENGFLVIEARAEPYGNRAYTSARLKTQGLAAWRYARVEARIQIPRGQGLWPAFWMLGDNISLVGWPACGEIDIMENIGREPGQVHGTVHGPNYSGANSIGGAYTLSTGAFADDYHVFAIEWQSNSIQWFVDSTLYRTVFPSDLPAPWVFDHPFFHHPQRRRRGLLARQSGYDDGLPADDARGLRARVPKVSNQRSAFSHQLCRARS